MTLTLPPQLETPWPREPASAVSRRKSWLWNSFAITSSQYLWRGTSGSDGCSVRLLIAASRFQTKPSVARGCTIEGG